MKKVFLSTPFSEKIDHATGEVSAEFRVGIEAVLDALRKTSEVEVFNALEGENWNISNTPPELGLKYNLEKLDGSDILLVLIGDTLSAGVQFEMGYAVAKNKQVILASMVGAQTPDFNQSVVSNGMMTHVFYDNMESLIKQLDVALHAPVENI